MKKLLMFFLIFFCYYLNGEELMLVKDGKPTASIIIAKKPAISARLAALEFQYHIYKMTGVTLPIMDDVTMVAGNRVLVGESRATLELSIRSNDFKPTEYMIKFLPNTLVLIGLDWIEGMTDPVKDPQAFEGRKTIDYNKGVGRKENPLEVVIPSFREEQGTCYAVYDFLERCCGVRWYGPSPLNIIIPKKQNTLIVTGADSRRFPSIPHRQLSCNPFPTENEILYGRPGWYSEEMDLFRKRVRDGGLRWYANHSALDGAWLKDEKTGEPLGYTDQRLVDKLVKAARDFFDGKGFPEFVTKTENSNVYAMGDYFAIVPNDSNLVRVTEEDRRAYAKGLEDKRGDGCFGTATDSYYLFQLLNRVAKELKKTHPGKKIATLAYKGYSYMPLGLEIESNICVAPCTPCCGYYKTELDNDRKFYRGWADWSKRVGSDIFIWDYLHAPYEGGIMRKQNVFPLFVGDLISDDVNQYVKDNVKGIFICGAPIQPDFYIYRRLSWDVGTGDYHSLRDEFFSTYFGRAGQPMKQFYLRVMEINKTEGIIGNSLEDSWKTLGTDERMKELEGYFTEAKHLAENDEEKARVDLWNQAFWERMVAGKRQYNAWFAKEDDRRRKVSSYEKAVAHEQDRLLHDKAPFQKLAADYIPDVRVMVSSAGESEYHVVDGKCMLEGTPGVLGTTDAKVVVPTQPPCWYGIGTDGVWIKFDLLKDYQLDEIRIWNHPDKKREMGEIRVECSLTGRGGEWHLLKQTMLGACNTVPVGGKVARYVRIVTVGGNGNVDAGLGQVRFYGQAQR